MSSRSDKPWLSKDLRASIIRKARVFKAYCQKKTVDLFEKLTRLGLELRKPLKQAKDEYLSSFGDKIKSNTKEVWCFVKNNEKDFAGHSNLSKQR